MLTGRNYVLIKYCIILGIKFDSSIWGSINLYYWNMKPKLYGYRNCLYLDISQMMQLTLRIYPHLVCIFMNSHLTFVLFDHVANTELFQTFMGKLCDSGIIRVNLQW